MNPSERFEILGEIGRGGGGVVYRAQDRASGRPVAIKIMLGAPSEVTRKRFTREALALARVRHPNVVTVFDQALTPKGEPFTVMELVEGESLQQVLKRDGKLPIKRAVEITIQLCEAVAACHRAGVLHRDLKPDNVLIAKDGALKLTDFGLVRDVEPSMSRTQLSVAGQFLGTPGYWAPEQAEGKLAAIGVQTDVYGLGATLFALLTGQAPQEGESLVEILCAARETKPAPSSSNSAVPSWLDAVVARALALEPSDRFSDPSELSAALAAAKKPARSGQLNKALGSVARNRLLVTAVGVLALSLLVLGALFATSSGEERVGAVAKPAAKIVFDARPDSIHGQAFVLGFRAEPISAKLSMRVNGGEWKRLRTRRQHRIELDLRLGENTVSIKAQTTDGVSSETATKLMCLSPTWWAQQDAETRVPYPLPKGLAFAEPTGEFTHTETGIALVFVPPGEFILGLNPKAGLRVGGEDQLPAHAAEITRGFFLGKYELTRGEYLHSKPATGNSDLQRVSQPETREDTHPVLLTWNEAYSYCVLVGFRLPTEAEWEYAAEGGSEGRVWPWGDDEPTRRSANLMATDDGFDGTSPVGSFPAGVSRWGAHDMAGNVYEWVQDVYHRYPTDPSRVLVDYTAPAEGTRRLSRGGDRRGRDITYASCNYRLPLREGSPAGLRVVFSQH